MKKIALTTLITACISGSIHAASIDDAFKKGSTSGQLRFAYISVAPDVSPSAKTTTAATTAGEIKFETAKWNRLQLGLAPYFAEKVNALSGDPKDSELNTDFLDSNNQSFAYLGEAYINYSFDKGSVRVGRQKLDTPFINTDDIRLFSNTFTAAWLTMELNKSITFQSGKVSTWAGFDSGSSQDVFKPASGAGNDGVVAAGISYAHSDALSANVWYYDFDKNFSLVYADATYAMGSFEFGAQYGSYSESNSSNTDGTVLGASVSYSAGPLTLAAVMNTGANDDGKSASLGLGGGNYYAAMDESTINGLNDVSAQVFSAEYAVSDKFTAAIAVGHFEDKGKATDIDETDLILGYNVSDNLGIEFTHTTVDNKASANDSGTNFTRRFLRATYAF